jgi:hypothetical protein
MSQALRHNRKSTDEQILRLNAIGLSMATIAKRMNCHHTCISVRLLSLRVAPADTRRAFMEDVCRDLSAAQESALADLLLVPDPHNPTPIKQYVRELVLRDLNQRQSASVPPLPLTPDQTEMILDA